MLTTWIIVGLVVVAVLALVWLWAANYRKVGPNQVLVISGRTSTTVDAEGRRRKLGYRLQVGGGTFVWPMLESAEVFPLEVFSISLRCPDVLTAQGVLISAEAQGQVKASSGDLALHRAVENFLSKGSGGITYVAQEVLEGHMRGILGTLAVEEIYSQREEFAQRLRDTAAKDFDLLGLEGDIAPRQEVTLAIHRQDGKTDTVPVILRIDTPIEVEYYLNGGILPYVLRQLLGRAS